jgi:hypothetical protein
MASDELLVLRQRPEWPRAVDQLRTLADERGVQARTDARGYGQRYAEQRGAMVVDVVTSRQRRYIQRVLPLVERWTHDHQPPTLRTLMKRPPDAAAYGLQPAEGAGVSKGYLSALENEEATARPDAPSAETPHAIAKSHRRRVHV